MIVFEVLWFVILTSTSESNESTSRDPSFTAVAVCCEIAFAGFFQSLIASYRPLERVRLEKVRGEAFRVYL